MNLFQKIRTDIIVDFRVELQKVALSMLQEQPEATYIDLGCDDCRLTKLFSQKIGTSNVRGIDLVDDVRRGIQVLGTDLNIEVPIGDNSVDVVTAIQIIEHLADPETFLREIHRVLKPNGYAIVGTNNLASWHNILYLILGMQPETAVVSESLYIERTEAPKHLIIFTLRELVKLEEACGFVVESSKGSSFPPLMGSIARIASRLDKRHSSFIWTKIRPSVV